ncbi:ubiquinone biosynthesis protein Coq4 [Flavobacterium sp. 28YEA47A]|uniref:Coq4 family protein n=1 Tax=Flavobacterium sp. 28YEA47A TaxID=3156276 RepID=UPI0035129AB3
MRDLFIEKLYDMSKKPYQKYFKKNAPWKITKEELLLMPYETLGFHLGSFLTRYNFDMQSKLEDHDVFHVLTKTGVTVPEEIGMQYFLFGNGKRSLYLYMVMATGTLFYPDQLGYFKKQYKRGQNALSFHNLDYSKMLTIPLTTIRNTFKIK